MKYLIFFLLLLPLTETYIYLRPEKLIEGEITAYNSEIKQTDSTPNITAYNTKPREGIVANNCLPKGKIVKIEEISASDS